jgi:hypothetical protein
MRPTEHLARRIRVFATPSLSPITRGTWQRGGGGGGGGGPPWTAARASTRPCPKLLFGVGGAGGGGPQLLFGVMFGFAVPFSRAFVAVMSLFKLGTACQSSATTPTT